VGLTPRVLFASEDSIVVIDREVYSGRASEGKNALIVARVQAEDTRSLARSESSLI
jgi:hypothetical protein